MENKVKLKDWRIANRYMRIYLREGNIPEAKRMARELMRHLHHIGLIENGIIREGIIYPASNDAWSETYAASEKMI